MRKQVRAQMLRFLSLVSLALALCFFAPQRATADDDDPPSRVARLAYARGNISFNPAGTDDWVTAVVNRPMTTGDKLWSDDNSRAELHLGYAVIRLSDHTGFSFLNLTDNITQLRLTEGALNIRVRRLGDDETFEVDTPNLALSILRPGSYRVSVNEAGDATIVAVREGQGEITGGGSAYTIHAQEEGFFNGLDQLDADIQRGQGDGDDFDQWCYDRDRREEHSASARYVSDDVVGYEDLDEYGGWRPVPDYGNVWFPHTVVVGWAPYRYGHWVWIAPWGWTWVDDEPWGFAPFHYGRWVVVGGVWGWVPSPPRAVVGVAYVRPVYAPALVAWVGGTHWGVGVVAGGAPSGVAWFPLGPRDVYCPSYHVSQRYVTNVNVSNTTIINRVQVTNVYNNVYVNKTVNVTNVTYQNQRQVNAVTATSRETFVSAGAVHNNMIRVSQKEVASATVAPMTPTVAPQQRSVIGAGAEARVRPPSPVLSRPVVARTAPPPAPVAFAKQQEIVRENGGRPPAISEMRRVQQQQENAQVERPNIRMAPPVRQGPPQNARDNRPEMPQGNPNRQGPPSNMTQPNQGQGQGQNARDNRQDNRPDMQQNNSNRPAQGNTNPANPPVREDAPNQSNSNRQGPPSNVNPPGQANRPDNAPGDRDRGRGNPRVYNDRPPTSRPDNGGNANPRLEQKQQQQLQDLRLKQDQERQKIEQQQVQQRQKIEQNNSNAQKPPQVEQRQQPQTEQRQQPQTEQRQPPPADDKRGRQQEQKQEQLQQKQQQQLQQLEQKHDQQQQRLEQKQQQERQKPAKQDKPPKDKPAKQDKKDDKPHR